MSTWWLALRLARREARRAKGRTTLVVVMIGLPVALLAFAAAVLDMVDLSPGERVTRAMGAADGIVQWAGNDPVEQDVEANESLDGFNGGTVGDHTGDELLALLPPGSRVSGTWQSTTAVRTADGVTAITSYGLDATDRLTAGLVRLDGGRLPRGDDEVAISPRTQARIGVRIGGVLRTVHPDRAFTVVGTVEVGGDLSPSVLFRPDLMAAVADPGGLSSGWLVGQSGPLARPQIERLNARGVTVISRALVLDPPVPLVGHDAVDGNTFGLGLVVVGLATLEVVLLAGPAFVVGARRRQRELALVAAAGGTPGMLRRIVLADGIVCGLLAAGAGLVIGVGSAFAGKPVAEATFLGDRLGADRVYGWAVATVVAVAVGTGLLGALLPAFAAGRQDVVATLAGRAGAVRSRRRWLALGVLVTASGAALALYVTVADRGSVASPLLLTGLVLGELGLVLCTPSIVGLVAGLGRVLPLAPRIALRDTARRRAAAAPAISAVMAAVAGSVAAAIFLDAQAAERGRYEPGLPAGSVAVVTYGLGSGDSGPDGVPDPAALATAVRAVLPGAVVTPVHGYECRPAGPDAFCAIEVLPPAARRCPYPADASIPPADQRRARSDPRCSVAPPVESLLGSAYVTDEPAVVAAVTGLRGAQLDDAVSTLRAGGVLVSDPGSVDGGQVLLAAHGTAGGDSGRETDLATATVPAYVVTTGVYLRDPIIGPKTAPQLPIRTAATGVVATPATPVTQGQVDSLRAVLGTTTPDLNVYLEQGDTRPQPTTALVLAVIAAIVALAAAAVATGLAAAEGRADMVTLAAVGAAPRTRRVLSLAHAGLVSGLGAVLGAAAGMGAAFAILSGLNAQDAGVWPTPPRYPLTVPWTSLAVALVAVPLVAMAGAGLLTRSRLPSERRGG